MKEKAIDKFLESFINNLDEDELKEELLKSDFKKEIKKDLLKDTDGNFNEELDEEQFEKMGKLLAQMMFSNNENLELEEDMCNVDNYIIKVKDVNKNYSLKQLLSYCSNKQLELYNYYYRYVFVTEKEKPLEDNIIVAFRKFLAIATKSEIKTIKDTISNNGVMKEYYESLINPGFIFPIKNSKKRIKYIMPKELVKIAKEYDFNKVSEEIIELCTKILEYLILIKGIITYDDAYDYLIRFAEFNIKKNIIKTILKDTFDNIFENYYIIKDSMDIETARNLVEIKEKAIDIPIDFLEMKEYFDMVMDLFGLFDIISNTEVNHSKYLKFLFYEPMSVSSLVKTLNTELKIKNKDKRILREFLEEKIDDFRYWIYNGEHDDISNYLGFDEDSDIEDLPF